MPDRDYISNMLKERERKEPSKDDYVAELVRKRAAQKEETQAQEAVRTEVDDAQKFRAHVRAQYESREDFDDAKKEEFTDSFMSLLGTRGYTGEDRAKLLRDLEGRHEEREFSKQGFLGRQATKLHRAVVRTPEYIQRALGAPAEALRQLETVGDQRKGWRPGEPTDVQKTAKRALGGLREAVGAAGEAVDVASYALPGVGQIRLGQNIAAIGAGLLPGGEAAMTPEQRARTQQAPITSRLTDIATTALMVGGPRIANKIGSRLLAKAAKTGARSAIGEVLVKHSDKIIPAVLAGTGGVEATKAMIETYQKTGDITESVEAAIKKATPVFVGLYASGKIRGVLGKLGAKDRLAEAVGRQAGRAPLASRLKAFTARKQAELRGPRQPEYLSDTLVGRTPSASPSALRKLRDWRATRDDTKASFAQTPRLERIAGNRNIPAGERRAAAARLDTVRRGASAGRQVDALTLKLARQKPLTKAPRIKDDKVVGYKPGAGREERIMQRRLQTRGLTLEKSLSLGQESRTRESLFTAAQGREDARRIRNLAKVVSARETMEAAAGSDEKARITKLEQIAVNRSIPAGTRRAAAEKIDATRRDIAARIPRGVIKENQAKWAIEAAREDLTYERVRELRKGFPGQYNEEIASKVAPYSSMGGVAGEGGSRRPGPLGDPIDIGQAKAIHSARSRGDVSRDTLHKIIQSVTNGRTDSAKGLSKAESATVLSRMKAFSGTKTKKASKPPKGDNLPLYVKMRPVSPQEVAEAEALPIDAVAEITARHKPKYARGPADARKLGLTQRIKSSGLYRLVASGNKSYETLVDDIFGTHSKSADIVIGKLRVGRSKTFAIYQDAQNQMLSAMYTSNATPKDIQSWQTRNESFKTPSGVRYHLTPSQQVRIAWLAKDASNVKAMLESGISMRGVNRRVLITADDLRAIDSRAKTMHPKLYSLMKEAFLWSNTVGREITLNTHWQETGKALEIKPGPHVHRSRDVPHLREEAARKLSPAEHQRAYIAAEKGGIGKAEPTKGMMAHGKPRAGRIGQIQEVQKRTDSKAPVFIDDFFSEFTTHAARISSYGGKAIPVRNARLILEDINVGKAIRASFADGSARIRQMQHALAAYEGLDVQGGGDFSRVASGMLRNYARSVLGVKPHIALYQPVSYLNAWAEIPAKHLVRALPGAKASAKEIKRWSPDIQARFDGSTHMLLSPSMTPNRSAITKMFWGGKRSLVDVPLLPIQAADRRTILRVWLASKLWAKADGFSGDELMNETSRRAQRAIDRTQPTWDPLTISGLQLEARQSPFAKQFMMFTSQSNKNLNMATRSVNEYFNLPREQRTVSAKARLLKGVSVPLAIQSTLIYAVGTGIKRGFYRIEGDDSYLDHTVGILNRALGGWLIFGNLLTRETLQRRLIQRLGDQKARHFIDPAQAPVAEMLNSLPEFTMVLSEYIEDEISKAKYKGRTYEADEKREISRAKLMLELIDKGGKFTGLPGSFSTQIARPLLLKRKEK